MTDERMTQGDVRLREELVATLASDGTLWKRFTASDGFASVRSADPSEVADALAPVVERIVAARVGEVVERVEAVVCTCVVDAAGQHYADCPATAMRASLRAADAPLSDQERVGGHGDAGGDAGAGEGRCDHPGITHGAFSYTWPCPRCGVCKFIGHGPLCGDCYTAPEEKA
jgi:hypothetical protein